MGWVDLPAEEHDHGEEPEDEDGKDEDALLGADQGTGGGDHGHLLLLHHPGAVGHLHAVRDVVPSGDPPRLPFLA